MVVETHVAGITKDMQEPGTERREVEAEKLMKKHEKAIPTGQALLSLCSFGRMAYTL